MGDAEHVLRPSAKTYYFTAVPVAMAFGLVGAWLYLAQLRQYRPSIPAMCALLGLVVISLAPFFLVLKSRVEFAPEAMRIKPLFGLGTISYPYSEIASIRASISSPAGGWIPGPDKFIFAIDFNDGRSWNSTWYPYESDPIQDSILIRYIAKKSGKPATPAPVL